jgi:hypothetical protein
MSKSVLVTCLRVSTDCQGKSGLCLEAQRAATLDHVAGKGEIAAADMPEANRFLLHVMAALAENEVQTISDRTRAVLTAAKARGVALGWSMHRRKEEQGCVTSLIQPIAVNKPDPALPNPA